MLDVNPESVCMLNTALIDMHLFATCLHAFSFLNYKPSISTVFVHHMSSDIMGTHYIGTQEEQRNSWADE